MIFRDEINESLTLKFAEAVKERKTRGEDILSLGLGEPDFNPPKELIESFNKALLQEQSARYSSSPGLPGLRQKIAKELNERNKINCVVENIFVTPGTKQSIILTLMAILEPEDEVIIIEPAYVSYIPQVYLAEPKAEVKIVPLDKINYNLNLEDLAQAITPKTKVLILNTPHNPTGTMISETDLRKVFEMTYEKQIYILSDEVYDKLVFSDLNHFSIGSLEEKPERVITINGFGKSFGVTGWRIGYCCLPTKLFGKVNKLQQHINTNTSTVVQMAFDLAWPLPVGHLEEYNRKLSARIKLYLSFLKNTSVLTGSNPKGSFFAFINISKLGMTSIEFASKLVENTGVAVTAGIAFGKEWDDHVRISLAVDDSVLIEAFKRIESFIKKEI
ncbi:MAG: pyridoxal phosphate-dependent aminotransferase [Bacteroidales bacterium]